MQKLNNAACVARVDGHACGLPPYMHAVERRWKSSPLTVGHGFVFAHGVMVNPKNSRDEWVR